MLSLQVFETCWTIIDMMISKKMVSFIAYMYKCMIDVLTCSCITLFFSKILCCYLFAYDHHPFFNGKQCYNICTRILYKLMQMVDLYAIILDQMV